MSSTFRHFVSSPPQMKRLMVKVLEVLQFGWHWSLWRLDFETLSLGGRQSWRVPPAPPGMTKKKPMNFGIPFYINWCRISSNSILRPKNPTSIKGFNLQHIPQPSFVDFLIFFKPSTHWKDIFLTYIPDIPSSSFLLGHRGTATRSVSKRFLAATKFTWRMWIPQVRCTDVPMWCGSPRKHTAPNTIFFQDSPVELHEKLREYMM